MQPSIRALVDRDDVTHVVREFEVAPEELDLAADGWTAAGAVVWNPRGEAVFVENSWSDGWVLPGGSVEDGESFAAAARREIREETGLDCEFVGPRRVEEQVFRAAEADAQVRGWFVAFAAHTDQTEFGADLGEHDGEIERIEWFAEPPAETASFVDAEAMLADCRVKDAGSR